MRRQNNKSQKQRKQQRKESLFKPYNPLRLVPSYPGQVIDQLWVGTNPQPLTTTVTTGVVAISASIDPVNDVNDWATRFQTLFVEYRVVKARARIQNFSSSNPGIYKFWVKTSGGSPTQAEALDQKGNMVPCSDITNVHELIWTPTDPIDLEYKACSVSSNPAYFRVYTNNANWGAPTVVTTLGTLVIDFLIQFREYV